MVPSFASSAGGTTWSPAAFNIPCSSARGKRENGYSDAMQNCDGVGRAKGKSLYISVTRGFGVGDRLSFEDTLRYWKTSRSSAMMVSFTQVHRNRTLIPRSLVPEFAILRSPLSPHSVSLLLKIHRLHAWILTALQSRYRNPNPPLATSIRDMCFLKPR